MWRARAPLTHAGLIDHPSTSRDEIVQFAVALSKTEETESAARAVVQDIRTQLNDAPIDLACVFFSAHHVAEADLLVHVLKETLRPSLLIGCSGEGVIAGAEELETVPAITVWAAVLPHVNLHPLRSSFHRRTINFTSRDGQSRAFQRRRSSYSPIHSPCRFRISLGLWRSAILERRRSEDWPEVDKRPA